LRLLPRLAVLPRQPVAAISMMAALVYYVISTLLLYLKIS
jgi:hypothetical protein